MHFLVYLVGIVHYLMIPFFLTGCNFECTIPFIHNEGTQYARWDRLRHLYRPRDEDGNISVNQAIFEIGEVISYIRLTLGVALCVWGQFEQYRHHCILARLRDNHKEQRYHHIPNDGWFKYVSSPHYLAEIIIYVSFFIMLRGSKENCSNNEMLNRISSLTGFPVTNFVVHCIHQLHRLKPIVCLIFVISNLSISAKNTHQWYITKFREAYPVNRKILVPFLW